MPGGSGGRVIFAENFPLGKPPELLLSPNLREGFFFPLPSLKEGLPGSAGKDGSRDSPAPGGAGGEGGGGSGSPAGVSSIVGSGISDSEG